MQATALLGKNADSITGVHFATNLDTAVSTVGKLEREKIIVEMCSTDTIKTKTTGGTDMKEIIQVPKCLETRKTNIPDDQGYK